MLQIERFNNYSSFLFDPFMKFEFKVPIQSRKRRIMLESNYYDLNTRRFEIVQVLTNKSEFIPIVIRFQIYQYEKNKARVRISNKTLTITSQLNSNS